MLSNFFFFFFNDTATTEIYTLSLHDALPISFRGGLPYQSERPDEPQQSRNLLHDPWPDARDRKSTRLNSSHSQISYAVFCLKTKKNINRRIPLTSTDTISSFMSCFRTSLSLI